VNCGLAPEEGFEGVEVLRAAPAIFETRDNGVGVDLRCGGGYVGSVGVEMSEGQIGAVLNKMHYLEAAIVYVFVNRKVLSRDRSKTDFGYMYKRWKRMSRG
jgi:hypothetical protein